jgi:hypothetical protein
VVLGTTLANGLLALVLRQLVRINLHERVVNVISKWTYSSRVVRSEGMYAYREEAFTQPAIR